MISSSIQHRAIPQPNEIYFDFELVFLIIFWPPFQIIIFCGSVYGPICVTKPYLWAGLCGSLQVFVVTFSPVVYPVCVTKPDLWTGLCGSMRVLSLPSPLLFMYGPLPYSELSIFNKFCASLFTLLQNQKGEAFCV